jgi:hypothetical protein
MTWQYKNMNTDFKNVQIVTNCIQEKFWTMLYGKTKNPLNVLTNNKKSGLIFKLPSYFYLLNTH